MKIHQLKCGTCCPPGGRLFDGTTDGALGHIVCHCLLIESDAGLILVDTGFGTRDIANRHHFNVFADKPLLDHRAKNQPPDAAKTINSNFHSHTISISVNSNKAGNINALPREVNVNSGGFFGIFRSPFVARRPCAQPFSELRGLADWEMIAAWQSNFGMAIFLSRKPIDFPMFARN